MLEGSSDGWFEGDRDGTLVGIAEVGDRVGLAVVGFDVVGNRVGLIVGWLVVDLAVGGSVLDDGCSEGALDSVTGQASSLLIFTLSWRFTPTLVSRIPKSPTTLSRGMLPTASLQTSKVTDLMSSPLLPIPCVPICESTRG